MQIRTNMQKRTRLPLLMKNGAEVQTLEELKENFSAEAVWEYWNSGVLRTWLEARYYEDIIDELEKIESVGDVKGRLYDIFGVENPEMSVKKKEQQQQRQEKLNKLREAVDEENFDEYKRFVDKMAFTQEDLYDFLDDGQNEVYLCGEKFEIPLRAENVQYIGVNRPIVSIRVKKKMSLAEERGIKFENVSFGEGELKNQGILFLIGYEPSCFERLPLGLGVRTEREIRKIVCEYEQVDDEEADEILDEIKEVTGEEEIIPAIYEIVNEQDDDEYQEILKEHGEAIKAIYSKCFS
ncbi:MAG: hypothetical protein MR012_05605 [Roseburia sp.]|nr:hypothetical protein [Roseburia sp.]